MATGGRKSHLQVVHEISQAFGPATPVSGLLGVLPAGAVLGSIPTQVAAAFNSITNTLSICTAPGGTQLVNALDLKTAARTDTAIVTAQAGPLAADTPIYYTLGSTGAAPTQGSAVSWLDYLPGAG